MLRPLMAVLAVISFASSCWAEDNPVMQKLIESLITRELVRHDTKDTGWESEAEDEHSKSVRDPITRKRITYLRWTDKSSSTVWLDDPEQNLSVTVHEFTIEDDTIHFEVTARAAVKVSAEFDIKHEVAKQAISLATGSISGTARIRIEIQGQTSIKKGKFANTKIDELEGRISKLRFSGELAKPGQPLVEAALNSYIKYKEKELKKDLEKVIDGTKI